MKKCFLYANDRAFETQQLLSVLEKNGIVAIATITNGLSRKECEAFYQEAEIVGVVLSPGLLADPLLYALVERATDDAIHQKKTVFPLSFTEEKEILPYLRQYAGVSFFSNLEDPEQKKQAVFRQLQKLVRWLQ